MYKLILNDSQARRLLCKVTGGDFALYFLEHCTTDTDVFIIRQYCKKNGLNYVIKNYEVKEVKKMSVKTKIDLLNKLEQKTQATASALNKLAKHVERLEKTGVDVTGYRDNILSAYNCINNAYDDVKNAVIEALKKEGTKLLEKVHGYTSKALDISNAIYNLDCDAVDDSTDEKISKILGLLNNIL